MNVYNVSIEPKVLQGSGIGHTGSGRNLTIVTETLQDALNIARTKLSASEEITGTYTVANDAIIDYSKVSGQNC